MIRAGFLEPELRRDLIELARDGSAAHRLARRSNALVLLDQGMSCGDVAQVLFLDDDTVWLGRTAASAGHGARKPKGFRDAAHAEHPVRCWGLKDVHIAVPQSSGRQRLNIYGAIDRETGKTRIIEAATVNAIGTIMLRAVQIMYPGKLVQAWLTRPECRIRLHFIPTYCPHLDPIERLWNSMHKHVTHNRCHEAFADFGAAIRTFLREEVSRKWAIYDDEVMDNLRIIWPKDFRVLT